MIRCTGICSKCGRCQNSAMITAANDRKTRMLLYPEDFEPDRDMSGFGLAFDIGTTTVVGMLWDLETGRQMAALAKSNSQNIFGMDVISRITFSMESGDNFMLLNDTVKDCLNQIADELCSAAGILKWDITKAAICGNTTMSHLFAAYKPDGLAVSPFRPAYTGLLNLKADESGMEISPEGTVTVLPNLAGHVGGDITAGIIATRLIEKNKLTLFIDIGTNGEIVLTDGEETLVCSTAAGPAFEGASIRYGMRAANGAIEKVMISDGEVLLNTIGEVEPIGICGSGLIDAVAQMLDSGIINKRGRIISKEDAEKQGMAPELTERIADIDGMSEFVLFKKDDGRQITITQNDIREVQLAKGAVAAGINLMLQKIGRSAGEIEEVLIAGAFGSYIDRKSAMRIGLLPQVESEKIHSAGNAAGAGVSMALLSKKELENAEELPSIITHLELAEEKDFQNVYMKAMAFI